MPQIHELDESGNVVSSGVVSDQSGDSGTSFWGVEVQPGNVASSMCPPKGALIHITHATLGHRLHHKKSNESATAAGPSEEKEKEHSHHHAAARCLVTASSNGTKTVICSLREGISENVPLNLLFDSAVAFTISGPCSVFLSGYTEPYDPDTLGGDDYEDDEDAEFIDDDEEEDEDVPHPLSFLMNGSDDEDVEDEEEDGEDEEEEEEEEQVIKANGKRAALPAPEPKKQKGQEENSKSKKQKVAEKPKQPAQEAKKEQEAKQQPAQKKQQQQKEKEKPQQKQQQQSPAKKEAPQTPKGKETPAKAKDTPASKPSTPQQSPKQDEKPKPVRLPNGLIYQDIQVGSGPVATRGRSVSMRYRGTLAKNGRQFDSNMPRGRPFVFRIGDGEVIRGWDVGIPGMKVGGKRRLTIPAELGYGRRGAPPDIPPNADLVFDVELLGVK